MKLTKPTEPSTLRRSTRLQANSSPNTLIAYSLLPEPIRESPQDLSDRQQTRGRKRPHDLENECPRKRLLTDLQVVSESISGHSVRKPLSEHNLQRHNRLLTSGRSIGMDSESDSSGRGRARGTGRGKGRGSKRAAQDTPVTLVSSRHSTTTTTDSEQETASVRSQKSSGTSAHYRWVTLYSARVYIRSRPPPQEIETQITAVISKVSPERKREISRLAQELCDSFAEVLSQAAGEDDCVELMHKALSSMGFHESLTFPRKSGIMLHSQVGTHVVILTVFLDWRTSLMPRSDRPPLDLSFMNEPRHEAENSTTRSSKRQQAGTYLSPRASGSATTGDTAVRDKVRFSISISPDDI